VEPGGGDVNALAAAGSTLYIGGDFFGAGGRLEAVDVATGATTDWNADASGPVDALATSGEAIYAGGRFTWAHGQRRLGLAALDAQTLRGRGPTTRCAP
jgi:outer membrane protein assembly factor BamB